LACSHLPGGEEIDTGVAVSYIIPVNELSHPNVSTGVKLQKNTGIKLQVPA